MKINKLIQLFNKQKKSAGYTLTELIIGAGISVVVIGAAGIGLMNLMKGNQTANTEADRRAEVNRSLEFIADEVRKAEIIATDPRNNSDFPTGFNDTGKEIVLALELPNLGQLNPNERVIYYVRPKPSGSNWLGPNVIYRYGPPLDESGGSYTGNAWVEQALVDRINDQTITPTCGGGETTISAEGFAACINNDEKIATIYVRGQFEEDSNEIYQANIPVYARSQEENLESSSPDITFNPLPIGGSGGPPAQIENIASEMGCNPSGDNCLVTTTILQTIGGNTEQISFDNKNNPGAAVDITIDSSQAFTVTVDPDPDGISNPYSSPTDQNNTDPISVEVNLSGFIPTTTILQGDIQQVKLLADTWPVPDNEPWNPSGDTTKFTKIKDILDAKGLIENGLVTLPPKTYLLVFEIGQTDTTHPGFDLQDQVILITVQD